MRPLRIAYANAIYHVYNQGVNKTPMFLSDRDSQFLIWLLAVAGNRYEVNIFCFATMQNHFHLLIQTKNPNISEVMWDIGYKYARYFNMKYNRVGHLFRNRFKSQLVVSDSYFRNVVSYIHNNPLEANLIKSIYEESSMVLTSFHDLMGITNDYPWLARKELFDYLGVNPNSPEVRDLLWKSIDREEFNKFTMDEKALEKMGNSKEITAA
jgi:REP element-mobilizing transposase RayT